MILVFGFASVLLSCLPLLHSATDNNTSMPICPKHFSCPNSLSFKYPFYNATDTRCGLIKVHCTSNGGEMQFGDRSYEIRSFGPDSYLVHDRIFQKLVETENCEALANNFISPSTSPSPLLFSISIVPFVNLYKCTNNHTYAAEMDAYFGPRNYYSHKGCIDYNFYYKYLINNASVPSDLPNRCELIKLPAKVQWTDKESDYTKIFSLLSPQFSISFPLSPSCKECRKKEGKCDAHNGKFQCLDTKKEKADEKLILIFVLAGSAFILLSSISFIICHLHRKKITTADSCLGFQCRSCDNINCDNLILQKERKLRWSTKTENHVNVENFLKNHEFLAPKRYSYSQVKKMTNSFKVKLGQGGYGSVYKGVLSNGNLGAVKVLSKSKGNGEDFINEVSSVGRTSHVNIVSLVGFCCESHRRVLIYEFMPNGSLEKFIYSRASSSNSQLGWEKLHQIAIGIARGLEYLHSGCNTRILHFDIKPHNILLDQDFCPKISDFGLAKLFPEKRSMISMSLMRGTPGYIAPELFSRNFGGVSHKSDVYSYGMMILEMVGGRKNVEAKVDHTSEIYFPHWIYKKVELDEELGLHGILSDEEEEMARKMIITGLWCIQTNPLSRPTVTKVLEMLQGDLVLLEIPPKPYLCSPSRKYFSSGDRWDLTCGWLCRRLRSCYLKLMLF